MRFATPLLLIFSTLTSGLYSETFEAQRYKFSHFDVDGFRDSGTSPPEKTQTQQFTPLSELPTLSSPPNKKIIFRLLLDRKHAGSKKKVKALFTAWLKQKGFAGAEVNILIQSLEAPDRSELSHKSTGVPPPADPSLKKLYDQYKTFLMSLNEHHFFPPTKKNRPTRSEISQAFKNLILDTLDIPVSYAEKGVKSLFRCATYPFRTLFKHWTRPSSNELLEGRVLLGITTLITSTLLFKGYETTSGFLTAAGLSLFLTWFHSIYVYTYAKYQEAVRAEKGFRTLLFLNILESVIIDTIFRTIDAVDKGVDPTDTVLFNEEFLTMATAKTGLEYVTGTQAYHALNTLESHGKLSRKGMSRILYLKNLIYVSQQTMWGMRAENSPFGHALHWGITLSLFTANQVVNAGLITWAELSEAKADIYTVVPADLSTNNAESRLQNPRDLKVGNKIQNCVSGIVAFAQRQQHFTDWWALFLSESARAWPGL